MIEKLLLLSSKWISNFFSSRVLQVVLSALNRFKMTKLKLKYFELNEFESPDLPGSGSKMDIDFLTKLEAAREVANVPFKINSGYRTQEHNLKVGGVFSSAHKKGLAADISAKGSDQKYIILNALMKVGFTRFGMGGTFIHVDLDKEKSQEVVWTY